MPYSAHLPVHPPVSLVERDVALACLHTAWAQVRQGQRQVVLVTGEPGIGKTAVVEAFMAQAADRSERVAGPGTVCRAVRDRGSISADFGGFRAALPALPGRALGSVAAPAGPDLVGANALAAHPSGPGPLA